MDGFHLPIHPDVASSFETAALSPRLNLEPVVGAQPRVSMQTREMHGHD
jgi:hypothetical protein